MNQLYFIIGLLDCIIGFIQIQLSHYYLGAGFFACALLLSLGMKNEI